MKYLKTFESSSWEQREQKELSTLKSLFPSATGDTLNELRMSWEDFMANPESWFAGNRFNSREEAMTMVEEMKALSARDIQVGGILMRENPIADTLYFDADEDAYDELKELCNPDEHRDDQGPYPGENIRFWWD